MDEYTSYPRVWGLTCPGSAEEVSRARRWARDVLRHCTCADDVALIVSELSSNAVLHTASGSTGHFHVALALMERVVAVSVMDAGGASSAPTVGQPNAAATHGRGLALVTTLATHVAIRRDGQGHTVTAELLMTPPLPGAPNE